jgi:hypothetical protein
MPFASYLPLLRSSHASSSKPSNGSISTSNYPIETIHVSSDADNRPPWENNTIPTTDPMPEKKQTRRKKFKKRPTIRERATKANRLVTASMVGIPHNKNLAAKQLAKNYRIDKRIQEKNTNNFNEGSMIGSHDKNPGVMFRYPYISIKDLVQLSKGNTKIYDRIVRKAAALEQERAEQENQRREHDRNYRDDLDYQYPGPR